MRADVDEVAGVVVEPGDDLGSGAVREGPVREVGLPGLVGLSCFEADQAAAWAFLRLRGDLVVFAEDAPDGRYRRWGAGFSFEVGANRFGAVIESVPCELGAQDQHP